MSRRIEDSARSAAEGVTSGPALAGRAPSPILIRLRGRNPVTGRRLPAPLSPLPFGHGRQGRYPQGWAATGPTWAVAYPVTMWHLPSGASSRAEQVEQRAAAPAGVQPFLALHQPGCFEQAQLERPAVGAGPFGRPPPVALEAPAEGTEVPANSPVALAHDQGGVELVIGAVTVAGVDLGGVPEATFGGAVEPSLGADQQGQRPQLAVSGPPAIALGTVELHPPVAIGITEPRPHALHHQPRHLSWHRRRPEGAAQAATKAPTRPIGFAPADRFARAKTATTPASTRTERRPVDRVYRVRGTVVVDVATCPSCPSSRGCSHRPSSSP